MRAAALLCALAGCLGCAGSPPLADSYAPRSRYFAVVGGAHPMTILAADSSGYSVLVEFDARGRALTDPLETWVQHCPRSRCEYPAEAFGADLVISCLPQNTPVALRSRHVFPAFNGLVHLYRNPDRPSRNVVVSAGPVAEVFVLFGRPTPPE